MNRRFLNTTIIRVIPHIVTVVVVALMLLAYRAWAMPVAAPAAPLAGPGVISYQGQLSDANDQPITGHVGMTFRLFDAPSGGTYLWQERYVTDNEVPVNNGLFNVLLGSINPIPASVWNEPALYLEIRVGGETLAPREPVGVVPYALFATTANRAYALSAPDGDPADAVFVNNDGKVGIGKPIPQAKLHVDGDIRWTGQLLSFDRRTYELVSGGGHKYWDLIGIDDGFCALRTVEFQNMAAANQICDILGEGGLYRLHAYADPNGYVRCRAHCLLW